MQDNVITRRLHILTSHLLQQNNEKDEIHLEQSNCNAASIPKSSTTSVPTDLSANNVKILLRNFVQDHTQFRENMFEWFFNRQDQFTVRSGVGDGTLEFIRQRSHNQAVMILKQKFITVQDVIDDPTKVFAFFESIVCDGSVNVKLSVHYNLFGACLAHLGTQKHHDKYFPDFEKGDQLSCFLMSELGHASNLRNLGTTATYDPESHHFVINTPNDASQKYWIGNAFLSAKIGVIFAQ
jgi:hypothetical protein